MPAQSFPPGNTTTTTKLIPSYLYVQYQDDDALQAFVAAYNTYGQAYLDYLNNLNLPIYTNSNISGPLLDWVALGIYGFTRPVFSTPGSQTVGPFNTWQFNTLPFNVYRTGAPSTYILADDDTFKRVLTWHLYKKDGKVFNLRWLKRRVLRFLYGANGTDPPVNPYGVSVALTAPFTATITVPSTFFGSVFFQGIKQAVLEMPFQINFTVNTVLIPSNALLDSNGQPILDSSGNFILMTS